MSEAEHLSGTRLWCSNRSCEGPFMERIFSMTIVGLEKFRGIEGQTTKETLEHWTSEARKADLDPVPVDRHSWT